MFKFLPKITLSRFILTASLLFLSIISFPGCVTLDPEAQALLDKQLAEIQDNVDEAWLHLFNNSPEAVDDRIDLEESLVFEQAGVHRLLGMQDFILGDNGHVIDQFLEAIEREPFSSQSLALTWFLTDQALYGHDKNTELMAQIETIVKSRKAPEWLKQEYRYFLFDHYYNGLGDQRKSEKVREDLNLVSDWRILGPFSNISHSGFNQDFINITSATSDVSGKVGKNNWSLKSFVPQIENPDFYTPVSSYLSETDYSSVYSFSSIDIEDAGPYELMISRQGSIEVWLDGEKIIEDGAYVEGRYAYTVRHHFEEGKYRIVVKTNNLEDSSAFSVAWKPVESGIVEKSRYYQELFSETTVFDPFIDNLCRTVENTPDSLEGYFWLTYILQEKGWIDQSEMVLDRLEAVLGEQGDSSHLVLWLQARHRLKNGQYAYYERSLLEMAEDNRIFGPARRFALNSYLQDERIGKLKDFIKRIKKDHSNWYYILEAELTINLIEENYDQAFSVLRRLEAGFEHIPHYYIDLLIYMGYINNDIESKILSNLSEEGMYRLGLYFQIQRGSEPKAVLAALESYLDLYPIEEQLWLQYLDYLYAADKVNFNHIRSVTSNLSQTFPVSYDLQLQEKTQSGFLYYDMQSFHDANSHLMDSRNPSVRNFLSDLHNVKQRFRQTLERIVRYFPFDLEARDQLRELQGVDPFGDKIEVADSWEIIEQFSRKTTDFAESDAVIVYDHRQEIFFGDGASTTVQHSILKILTEIGIEDNRYQYLEFHPSFGDGVLKEAFILKEDGTQTYADRAGQTLAFPGLSIGDYIVVKYYAHSYMPGEINNTIWTSEHLQSDYPIFNKQFSVVYPEDVDLTYRYNNIAEEDVAQKTVKFIEGYEQTVFTVRNAEALETGSLAPSWRDIYPWVDISSIESWDTIINWYENLYLGQAAVTDPVSEAAQKIIGDASDPTEKIRLIFDYVSGKIEYEDLSFLYSNFVPQTASSVLSDGYGDCKDQSVLLISMLEAVGIDSYIALNTPDYNGNAPFLPSPRFTHAIVVVPSDEGVLYLDPTTTFSTFDELPASMIGSYSLHVTEDGSFQRIEAEVDSRKTYYLLEMENLLGTPELKGSIVYQGHNAGQTRAYYKGLSDAEQRRRFNEITNSWLPGFSLENFESENLDNLMFDPRFEFSGTMSSGIIEIGGGLYKVNSPSAHSLGQYHSAWLGIEPGRMGVEISDNAVATPVIHTVVFQLPSGYSLLALPENRTFSFNQSYAKFHYEQKGNSVICTKEFYIPNQTVSAEEYAEFKTFILKTIEQDQSGLYLRRY